MALLSTKGLSVQIGDVVVVENLSIEVGPGQFWGLLGPNGVGKTTLLKTLAGVHPARAGQVLLDGKPLGALKRRTIARRLGMLPQHTQYVFEASCEQTALVGRHPHLRAWDRESAADRGLGRPARGSRGG
ncbi:MAG: ABC transporter ATP-binding protein, partial [Wenzhouxiangella sp.]|nr:ABC transporter ATP-binding protein [Wenzhouxiangella sp.]